MASNPQDDGFSQLDDDRETNGCEWPNCSTPDCEHKRCDWGSETRCHFCEERRVGKVEMDRRYHATHSLDGTWNGVAFDE